MKKILILIIFGIILGFLLKTVAFELFTVPTDSMQPTILRGSKIWVNKFFYWGFDEKDIVAFNHRNENYVKRILAVPHDTVYFDGSRYTTHVVNYPLFTVPNEGETVDLNPQNINFYLPLIEKYEGVQAGQVLDKIYIEGKEVRKYTFKNKYYFLQGDNIAESIDSRQWGLIPEYAIFGKIM